jgi:RNA polymerase sigma-70 factor (ECF subfamily)
MLINNAEDHDLVSAYVNGCEESFQVLLFRHKYKIYNFILSKVRNQAIAEDLFQDTFIKIINTLKKGSYNEEGKFLPWAMRIAHNLIIDYFRKSNKVRFITESSSVNEDFNILNVLEIEEKNIQDVIIKEELESQMVELVQYLPPSQKNILEMRIFQEISFKDIAEIEGISINTALGRMRYALINLRKMIEKNNLVTTC